MAPELRRSTCRPGGSKKLYHLTNATDYAANFFELPVIAYNGDQDPQRQAWTLKYNQMRWVVVDGLGKHWERARVDASLAGDHAVNATTVNVSAVSFEMGVGAGLLNPASKVTVSLDGEDLAVHLLISACELPTHFRRYASARRR